MAPGRPDTVYSRHTESPQTGGKKFLLRCRQSAKTTALKAQQVLSRECRSTQRVHAPIRDIMSLVKTESNNDTGPAKSCTRHATPPQARRAKHPKAKENDALARVESQGKQRRGAHARTGRSAATTSRLNGYRLDASRPLVPLQSPRAPTSSCVVCRDPLRPE